MDGSQEIKAFRMGQGPSHRFQGLMSPPYSNKLWPAQPTSVVLTYRLRPARTFASPVLTPSQPDAAKHLTKARPVNTTSLTLLIHTRRIHLSAHRSVTCADSPLLTKTHCDLRRRQFPSVRQNRSVGRRLGHGNTKAAKPVHAPP